MAALEDVLEVYQCPYDPLCPVVCIDKTNKQLIEENHLSFIPRCPQKADSVYMRDGVAELFMISKHFVSRSETVVTQTRIAVDFAKILKHTSDAMFPRTEKIILVTDNLNTAASLYKTFKLEETHRLSKRFKCTIRQNMEAD